MCSVYTPASTHLIKEAVLKTFYCFFFELVLQQVFILTNGCVVYEQSPCVYFPAKQQKIISFCIINIENNMVEETILCRNICAGCIFTCRC